MQGGDGLVDIEKNGRQKCEAVLFHNHFNRRGVTFIGAAAQRAIAFEQQTVAAFHRFHTTGGGFFGVGLVKCYTTHVRADNLREVIHLRFYALTKAGSGIRFDTAGMDDIVDFFSFLVNGSV